MFTAALAMPAISHAQAVRLEVRDVRPVQVIEDVPLIVGKPTVVKVVINASRATQATLEVALGASRKTTGVRLNRGLNTFYVPVDPPGAPGSAQVSAAISATSGGSNSRKTQVVQVVAPALGQIRVVFLPVDWSEGDRAGHFPGRYNSFVGDSGSFFRATYPLPDSNVHINASPNTHMLGPAERAIADAQGNLNWDNITAMYTSMAVAGRMVMPDADLVVGVLPPKWFARNLNEPNTVGLEVHAVRQVVAAQVDADYATLAHEVGHVFGREDEYDFSANPPRIGNRIDAPGYWVSKSEPIYPDGRTVYYSFMGASDRRSRYWVDRSTYLAILEVLQRGSLP
jgi:hypothetical protein